MRSKPKVLIFARESAVPPVTGAGGVYSWGIAKGFSDLGYNVLIVSKMFFKRIKPFEKKNIYIIRCIRFPYFLRKYTWALELFLSYILFRPELVFIRLPEKNFISDLKYLDKVIRFIKVPVSSKINFVPNRWSKSIDKVLRHSDYIICETNGHKNFLEDSNQKKALVLPNGIDLDLFNYEKTQNNKQNKNYIVLLGSVDKYRNTVEFVKIFSKSKIRKDIKLKIIGDGPDSLELRKTISKLGIENRVELIGKVPHEEIPFLIKNSLLGVVLPHKDSLLYTHPLKLFEFLSMGVPVLTTKELEITKELNQDCLIAIKNCSTENVRKALENINDLDENVVKICVDEANKYSWENVVKRLLIQVKK